MKGDFSRDSFRPFKHFASVRTQQGRVLTDADNNEQVDIQNHVRETSLAEIIGCCGAAYDGGGFKISALKDGNGAVTDLALTPGLLFAGGVLCELEASDQTATVTVTDQAGGKVEVEQLTLDGRQLEVNDWVEVFTEGAADPADFVQYQITAITEETLELTLSGSTQLPAVGDERRLRRLTTLFTQPDYPRGAADPHEALTEKDKYLVYLDVWRRHITMLDDADIAEPALGGIDTATRARTVWQVKVHVEDKDCHEWSCDTLQEEFGSAGKLQASILPVKKESDNCQLSDQVGYRGFENQLYRVEVHDPGDIVNGPDLPSLKVSRDNGHIVSKVKQIEAASEQDKKFMVITVVTEPKDDVLWFIQGRWAELRSEAQVLLAEPGDMYKVSKVEGRRITLEVFGNDWPDRYIDDSGDQPVAASEVKAIIDEGELTLRRWDNFFVGGSDELPELPGPDDDALELEDNIGIGVRFTSEEDSGRFITGDYWLIPARTSGDGILWPRDELADGGNDTEKARLFLGPHGIKHHYCALATIAGGEISDCRPPFPRLTEMVRFYYAGGDGQEVFPPGEVLEFPLRVGVAMGQHPLANWAVEFKVESGGGGLGESNVNPSAGSYSTTSSDNGLAECFWKPDSANWAQHVSATLFNPMGEAILEPIIFSARLNLAEKVYYRRKEGCTTIADGVDNVQDAIDDLCNISADQIDYERIEGCTKIPASVTNVKDAIDALCLYRAGGGCAVRVGDGGDYPDLRSVFEALAAEERIWICLLPGRHDITGLKPGFISSLKITGCGPASLLTMSDSGALLGARHLQLENLNLTTDSTRASLRLVGESTLVRNCRFRSTTSPTSPLPPLVLVSGPDETKGRGRLVFHGNTIDVPVISYPKTPVIVEVFRPTENIEALSKTNQILKSLSRDLVSEAPLNDLARVRRLAKVVNDVAAMPKAERQAWVTAMPKLAGVKLPAEQKTITTGIRRALTTNITPTNQNEFKLRLKGYLLQLAAAAARAGLCDGLALTPGVDGWIEENQIQGNLRLMYEPGPSRLLMWAPLDEGVRARIKEWLKGESSVAITSDQLHIRGNSVYSIYQMYDDLDKILTSEDISGFHAPGYNYLAITDNLISGYPNGFISHTHMLKGNTFYSLAGNGTVAYVLGYMAYIDGNLALSDNYTIEVLVSVFHQLERATIVNLVT